MQRGNFRTPQNGTAQRAGGFRSPPPGMDRPGCRFPSPPWARPNAGYGPRFSPYGGGSPDTPPRDFSVNRGGKYNNRSPLNTPRRSNCSPAYRTSPYQSPGQSGAYQGSPRTSTPYGRERGANEMDKYYKASMLQDPWANLKPVSVTDTQSKCSTQQATHTGRPGRYYNQN
ncbi:M-phase-specific PLK1-interacting protein [Trichomycterus rosablanca]|uniref:M-phase-specific PLK1-interacting protein n=1 Tax=Trichomycterus rosablanca TaxID=2290929 RepID=UPI002F35A341